MKLTAIIPTYNEEKNIQRALNSVCFADEVIVIDSYSTDKTVEIVEKSSAILIQRPFDNFSLQKNYAISKATNNWILVLDADEELPIVLQNEILTIVKSKETLGAYYIYRVFYMKNERLKFSGWQRDKVIRLFKRDEANYVGKVHEQVQALGDIGYLKHKINHFSYSSEKQYLSKLRLYAKLQAEELFQKGKRANLIKQNFKPIIRFIIHFIVRLGFLDGKNGLKISKLHAYGVWLRYKELKKIK